MTLINFKRFRNNAINPSQELIAALDVGTSKICCAIARVEPNDELRMLGIGYQASKGLKNGRIVDMESAELSILNAVHVAEKMAGGTIQNVAMNVSFAQSQMVRAELSISGHAVDNSDVRRLLIIAQQMSDPIGCEPIHAIPMSYDIDGRQGIHDPRGMYGDILGVNIHKIFSLNSDLRNLSTCVGRCHLESRGFIFNAYAAGLATLVNDEIELGVTVIDMGAGTTSIAVFSEGSVIYIDSIAIGGNHVTNDIARVLSTPITYAERLKTLYGSALSVHTDQEESIRVPLIGDASDVGSAQLSRFELIRIIRPRLEETFELIRSRLETKGIDKRMSQRIVLTGGASQMPGIRELASGALDKQVRLGKSKHIHGLNEISAAPSFSTCLGLLMFLRYAREEQSFTRHITTEPKGVLGQMGAWLRENF